MPTQGLGYTWTSRPPSLSLRATTSTWLLPRNTLKLCGPLRDTFTVYFIPAVRCSAFSSCPHTPLCLMRQNR